MTGKSDRNHALIKNAYAIIKQHKRLLLFPVLGYIIKYIIYSLMAMPFIKDKEALIASNQLPSRYMFIIIIGFMVVLFIINLILFFFNSAIIENLLQFFKTGHESRISYGFMRAIKSYFRVYRWAFYAGTYGVIVNLLPRDNKKFKRLRQRLHYNHWNLASLFCLILVIDKSCKPVEALDKSSELVFKVWGNNLKQRFSLNGYMIWFRLISFIPLFYGLIDGNHNTIIITGFVTVFLLLISSICYQMINTTWRVVCYYYAMYGEVAAPFTENQVKSLFKTRSKKPSPETQ